MTDSWALASGLRNTNRVQESQGPFTRTSDLPRPFHLAMVTLDKFHSTLCTVRD